MTNWIGGIVPFRYIPEFLRLFINPDKHDTSSWNVFYYYYRQIHQSHIGLGIKSLKWFSLGFQVFFFFNVLWHFSPLGIYLDLYEQRYSFPDHESFDFLFDINGNSLFVFLAITPVIMVHRAFRMRAPNSLFLTSSAKEPLLIQHLGELSSFDGLIQGIVQSLLYTYIRLFICLLPAIIFVFANGSFTVFPSNHPFSLSLDIPSTNVFVPLACSIAVALFIVIQPFCFRLDTLYFAVLLIIEWNPSIGEWLFDMPTGIDAGQVFYFNPLMWCACMFYFPLAAIDTSEYGIEKHAKTTRVLLLGIVAINFLLLFIRMSEIKGWENFFLTEAITMPALWGIGGILGLHVTSLSTASRRAKKRFLTCAQEEKKKLLFRFFNPTSPASIIPICSLEIVMSSCFVFWTKGTYILSFWLQSIKMPPDALRLLMFALVLWTSCHLSLTITQIARRYSRKDTKAWHTHIRFNLLLILFYEVFGNPDLYDCMPYYPVVFYCISFFSLFILWEPITNHQEGDKTP